VPQAFRATLSGQKDFSWSGFLNRPLGFFEMFLLEWRQAIQNHPMGQIIIEKARLIGSDFIQKNLSKLPQGVALGALTLVGVEDRDHQFGKGSALPSYYVYGSDQVYVLTQDGQGWDVHFALKLQQ
jgi:hypothetical protein